MHNYCHTIPALVTSKLDYANSGHYYVFKSPADYEINSCSRLPCSNILSYDISVYHHFTRIFNQLFCTNRTIHDLCPCGHLHSFTRRPWVIVVTTEDRLRKWS